MLNSKNKKLIILAIIIILIVVGLGLALWYFGRQAEDKNTKEYQKYQTVKKEQTQKVEADKTNALPVATGEPAKTLTPLPEGAKPLPPLPN